jgi:hypothetical protein
VVTEEVPQETLVLLTILALGNNECEAGKLKPIDLSPIYNGNALDAAGEEYCTTDVCEIKFA